MNNAIPPLRNETNLGVLQAEVISFRTGQIIDFFTKKDLEYVYFITVKLGINIKNRKITSYTYSIILTLYVDSLERYLEYDLGPLLDPIVGLGKNLPPVNTENLTYKNKGNNVRLWLIRRDHLVDKKNPLKKGKLFLEPYLKDLDLKFER